MHICGNLSIPNEKKSFQNASNYTATTKKFCICNRVQHLIIRKPHNKRNNNQHLLNGCNQELYYIFNTCSYRMALSLQTSVKCILSSALFVRISIPSLIYKWLKWYLGAHDQVRELCIWYTNTTINSLNALFSWIFIAYHTITHTFNQWMNFQMILFRLPPSRCLIETNRVNYLWLKCMRFFRRKRE